MKTSRYLLAVAAAMATSILPSSLKAQNVDASIGGLLVSANSFSPLDMLRSSQNDYSLTTGRVAAMGGAFTALGGDMATIGINPAGLGMYRTSAWGFSPALTFSDTKSGFMANSNNTTRFGFSNIGTVLRLVENSSGLISFNIGISYNKSDDFNFSGSVSMPGTVGNSLLQIFQLQLNGLYNYMDYGKWDPLNSNVLNDSPFYSSDIYIDEWGAVLGYQSGLFSQQGNGYYALNGLADNGNMTSTLSYDSCGSAGEYNVAGGFNINNILYLGFDFGFKDIYQKMSLRYSEDYASDNGLRGMAYNQYSVLQGSAFNFKIGAILRPIEQLTIGIAYHTPSYTNLRKEYYSNMNVDSSLSEGSKSNNSLLTGYDYSFNTPSRLMAGIAYTIGNRFAISFDYEKVWYNKMRYTSETYEVQESFRQAIANDYRAADNFKVGIEFKPLQMLALRAGYAYYGSPIKETDSQGNKLVFNGITTTSSNHISAGIGIWLGRATTLDIAYVYSRYNIAPYAMYYYTGQAYLPSGSQQNVTYAPQADIMDSVLNRHFITFSFNFLF